MLGPRSATNVSRCFRRIVGGLGTADAAIYLLLAATAGLFWETLHTYFVGDDFFWLYNGRYVMTTPSAWANSFIHVNGSGQYRPLTLNVFFWAGYHMFGMHPLPFHLVLLGTFLVTIWILYMVSRRLGLSPGPALAGTAIFAFSNTHYEGLAWIDAFTETAATLLFVGTLYFVVRHKRWHAVALYCLCLLSNETTVVLPAVAVLYWLLVKHSRLRQAILQTRWLWVCFSIYTILRVGIMGIRATGPFRASFSPTKWLRLIGSTIKQGLGFTPTFLNGLGEPGLLHAASVLCMAGSALVLAVIVVTARRQLNDTHRTFLFGAATLLVGLLPVLPFSYNWSQYNMSIGLLGLGLAAAALVERLPLRRLWAATLAIALLGINLIAVYGPGGNNTVDGVRTLARLSQAVTVDIQREEAHRRSPISVDIIGDFATLGGINGVSWALNSVSLAHLVDPGGTVHIGPTRQRASMIISVSGARTVVKKW